MILASASCCAGGGRLGAAEGGRGAARGPRGAFPPGPAAVGRRRAGRAVGGGGLAREGRGAACRALLPGLPESVTPQEYQLYLLLGTSGLLVAFLLFAGIKGDPVECE